MLNHWIIDLLVLLLFSAWRQRTLAVQTAVELLANICSMDDAAEQLDDSGWDADDADVPASAGGAENMTDVPAVFRVALEAGVLARLLARCTPPPAAMSSALHELLPTAEATQSINAVYSCATKSLTALNNMMLVLPAVALGDLSSVWTHAFALASELNAAHEAFSAEQALALPSAADPDASDSVPLGVLTLSACTDLMWSILRKNIAVVLVFSVCLITGRGCVFTSSVLPGGHQGTHWCLDQLRARWQNRCAASSHGRRSLAGRGQPHS
jgi:hypothetical protein